MEFVTKDGKLFFSERSITQKRLTREHKTNNLLFIFFFIFLLNLLVEKIDEAVDRGSFVSWVMPVILSLLLIGYLFILFDLVFFRSWKKTISVDDITSARIERTDEGLETRVTLRLSGKKRKTYIFRTLEQQAEKFVETLLSANPGIPTAR